MKSKLPPFEFAPFSKKQLKVLTFWCDNSPYKDWDGIICDGAVRSGKTVSMAISFVCWAMSRFNETDFALCGKTVGSLRRNVVNTLKRQLSTLGYDYDERRTENLITISKDGIVNYFYLFGGKDESSQDLIQGMTLGGILFDEVALMPQSFVTQGEARCSLEGAKMWYNCNPKAPNHWFKQEYIDLAQDRFLLYLHFTMDDNLTLSDAVKDRYKRTFVGVFYQRNVLGLWVTAEGKIYTAFGKENIIPVAEWEHTDSGGRYTNELRNRITYATIGVDFGGYKSSHAFQCTGFTAGFKELITVKEKRIIETEIGLTPMQLEAAFVEFVKDCIAEYPVKAIYCDSAEQVLIRGFKKALQEAHIPVAVKNARKGEIIDRIRFYSAMQAQHRYFVISNLKETIDAFDTAVWDDKHNDTRLDDGTTNIDTLDAQEYCSEALMKTMIDLRKGVINNG